MGTVTIATFMTLDGIMQAPGGPDEDRDGGFEHGGWSFPYFSEDMGEVIGDAFANAECFLLGRKTYEIFAASWPNFPDKDDPVASKLNNLPKYVVSTTLEEPLEWNNSTLITDDVPNRLAKLKERPGGDLLVFGSGDLVQTLMEQDLVDEYRLQLYPLVLGSGKRLFRDSNPTAGLRLVESTISKTGTLIVTYAPEGPK